MNRVQARVSEGGRIVIPADFRRELNIQEGDLVRIQLEDGILRVTPARTALHRACELDLRDAIFGVRPTERKNTSEMASATVAIGSRAAAVVRPADMACSDKDNPRHRKPLNTFSPTESMAPQRSAIFRHRHGQVLIVFTRTRIFIID